MTASSPTSLFFRHASAGRVTAALLLAFLAITLASASGSRHNEFEGGVFLPHGPGPVLPNHPDAPKPAEHTFTLRHIYHHGTTQHPGLHRKRDVIHDESRIYLAAEDEYGELEVSRLKVKSRADTIERLVDRRPSVIDPMVAESRKRGFVSVLDASAWTVDQISSPDVTDKDTVVSMAYIAANAYVQQEGQADWEDVGNGFNRSLDFGWEGDGLRGHVWADETNSTVVIGLKGTSVAVFDGEGTTTNDKVNDNLFFSCCCGQQGQWSYHQVCDCATGTYACNTTCVAQSLREENRYYAAARELYSNVTEQYPNSNIWLAGHSLGGAISSMLALTYGVPAVTFEAVPEALPISRLGLPIPPGANANTPQARAFTGTYHFGHTADPIYIGTCNGAAASCSYAGYALESACHTGFECVYDVVADKGWRVGIGTHKIRSVIHDVLLKYDTVPKCVSTPECRDCAQWKMYKSNGTESTTSAVPTTTSRIRTRTTTCETPGWWGCLDSSTGTPTTTTTTPTTSTSTCKTPGWFGCKDKTTTFEFTPTQSTSIPSTTSCLTPGRFWGCNDGTTVWLSSTTNSMTPAPSTTCETPGKFWGCRDDLPTALPDPWSSVSTTAPLITPAPTGTPVSTTSAAPSTKTTCRHRNWLGFCKDWQDDGDHFSPDEI